MRCNSHTIKFTFLVYNSVFFNISTMLYNHHHYLIPQHFHCPEKKPLHPLVVPSHFSLPQSLVTTDLLCLYGFAYSGHSYKSNHTICGLLFQTSIIQHIFKVHPHCGMYQYFIPFLLTNNIPLYGCTTYYLSIHQWMNILVVSTFWLL